MKKFLAPLMAALLLFSASSVGAVTPTVTLESQVWWHKTAIVVPEQVGSHIHVRATVPLPTAVVSGPVTIPMTVTLHNAAGPTNFIRIQAVSPGGSNREVWRQSLSVGPCADCSADVTAVINTSGWATGRHELRISANTPDEDPALSGSQRMYQSTGWQMCVGSCSPSYRSGNFVEARGWYTGRDYANARLTSSLSTVRSGGTITVKLAPGAGGEPTKFSGVFIDPDFHNGSAGIVVDPCKSDAHPFGCNGPFSGSIVLPTLTSGTHRLALLSSDSKVAGVQIVVFTTP